MHPAFLISKKMSTANTFVEEDGFGLVKRPDHKISSSHHRCYEIVRRYTMTNSTNSSVRLITWGAGIQSIKVPNDKGTLGDVVLGYDSMDGYLKTTGNWMSEISNRVSPRNDASEFGFESVNWESNILGKEVVMSNIISSTAEGRPVDMLTQVKFSWSDDNELRINVRATSTYKIPTNITTRCLLNLAGHGTGPKELRNHVVTINASEWTLTDPVDKVPTGAIRPVASTVYDLRFPTRLTSERLRLVPGGGYDQNLCVEAPSRWCYRFNARILHPGSGRVLEVFSNQPGLQFYTANDLPEPEGINDECNCSGDREDSEEKIRGKDGVLYTRHGGFGISPQNYPNAINTEGFPPCVLYPGKVYANDMSYKFGTLVKTQ